MGKPLPPCVPDCEKRSLNCHNREVCAAWGRYQVALAEYRRCVKAAKRQEDDFTTARRLDRAQREWRRKTCR